MKEHFAQTLNETEHLIEMEHRGGADRWVDRFFAYHLVLIYYLDSGGLLFCCSRFCLSPKRGY